MSNFSCPIVEVQGFGKHPNADALSVTDIMGSTCIFKTGTFQKGDLAVFIPVDAVVPLSHKAFAWLADKNRPNKTTHRVKAKKLRGVFSDGFLVPMHDLYELFEDGILCEPSWDLGDDAATALGVVKYEEPEPVHMNTGNRQDPGYMPIYDLEPWKKNKYVINEGDEVVITEKIHGMNSRFLWREGELFVGSHRCIKAYAETNVWWKVAMEYDLEPKLLKEMGIALYGEVYGTQDLKYGQANGKTGFMAFDAYDTLRRQWLPYDEFLALCQRLGVPTVPVLYRGPYSAQALISCVEPAEGEPPLMSTIADCIREGAVIRTTTERWHQDVGRVQLKLVSQAYLLRNGGSEFH